MQILVVIIERDGENYTGRSPNLLGVSVTAKTYDEAQTAILDALEKRINELQGMHSNRRTVSRLPIEESIGCVYDFPEKWRKDDGCGFSAQKDGLCQIHWRKLYSHAFGSEINLRACPLCGESDQEVLKRWNSPCPVKAENPNWADLLEEKKRTMKAQWKKERLEIRLEKLGNNPQCSRTLSSGGQCYKEVYRRELCFSHSFDELDNIQNSRSDSQNEKTHNYFKSRFRNK